MSEGKKFSINLGDGGWIFWLALIVLCWGEPDVLDGIVKRVHGECVQVKP